MYLTRKIRFSAAHACRNIRWTEQQNLRQYGACAMGSGHGHDYICEVTVKGVIRAESSIVVNLVDIKQILNDTVGVLDMTHLNHDVMEFQGLVPSSEILTYTLWNRLDPGVRGCTLFRVRLHESRTRYIEYYGGDDMMYVTRQIEFNAAHRLHSPMLSDEENALLFGKCNNPNGHGHNYQLEVTVRGTIDMKTGTVMALGELDRVIESEVLNRFDHKNLNEDLEEFRSVNPTSEEFARVIWNRLVPHFTSPELYKIRLVETSNNAFEYYGEIDGRPY